jgi:hypothetical protein
MAAGQSVEYLLRAAIDRPRREEDHILSPRIGCIGSGYWGRNLVRNFHALGVLAAVCEASASTRAELSDCYPDVRWTGNIDDLLRDTELAGVAIATPAETHGSLVLRALQAGKDVFVEGLVVPLVAKVQELVPTYSASLNGDAPVQQLNREARKPLTNAGINRVTTEIAASRAPFERAA